MSELTNEQIAAGAAVIGDNGRPIGRNTAIMVADAMFPIQSPAPIPEQVAQASGIEALTQYNLCPTGICAEMRAAKEGRYFKVSDVERILATQSAKQGAQPDQSEEIKQLRNRVSQMEAARIGYASEFPLTEEGEPDVGSIHANIRALKAQVAQERAPVAEVQIKSPAPAASALDLADLASTAKEALHGLLRVEIHLEQSDAPITIKNSAVDVRLCIKELQAALKSTTNKSEG